MIRMEGFYAYRPENHHSEIFDVVFARIYNVLL